MSEYAFYLINHYSNGQVRSTTPFSVYAESEDEAQALAQTFISKRPYVVGYQTVSKVWKVEKEEALVTTQ